MVSELAGGKFGAAFAGGFAGSMMAHLGPQHESFSLTLVQAAATGGAASKVAGGSFTNAAVTSAFQVMFNAMVHEAQKKSFRGATLEAAAKLRALQSADRDDSEWGTVIGVNQNGEHVYAPPVLGIDQDGNAYSVDPSRAKLPDGFKSTGHYLHSHPHNYQNEFYVMKNGQPANRVITYFSDIDILWAGAHQRKLWVVTPNGHLSLFEPVSYPNNVQELGYRRPLDYQLQYGQIRTMRLK